MLHFRKVVETSVFRVCAGLIMCNPRLQMIMIIFLPRGVIGMFFDRNQRFVKYMYHALEILRFAKYGLCFDSFFPCSKNDR